ncbi:MAG: putative sugar O-methyltransferase [Alphaproteobacteria bacterium]
MTGDSPLAMKPQQHSVDDDPDLLDLMMRDAERQSGVWQPQAKWRDYARRIDRELRRVGLADFRSNQDILSGFTEGGLPRPAMPHGRFKRLMWDRIATLPVVRRIVGEYEHLLLGQHRSKLSANKSHARMMLDRIADTVDHFEPPAGMDAGGGDDTFIWRGRAVSAAWVQYVSRAVDLYRSVDRSAVGSILEIGPGLGFSTLAHFALNPELRLVVNVDIPPVLYVATQFLKAIPGLTVVDYRQTRDLDRIDLTLPPAPERRVYQLAPWQIARLAGEVDVGLNAASFAEMSPEVCANYARHVCAAVRHTVMLHTFPPEEATDDGPLSGRYLVGLFADAFPRTTVLDSGWCDDYVFYDTYKREGAGGYAAVLLQRG